MADPSMATSRTGTAKYLRNRALVIRRAKADGITHCPGYELPSGQHHDCGNLLDYETPYTPTSAEVDHIIEYRNGGTDDNDNLRVLCRTCNLARNRAPIPVPDLTAFPTSRMW